MDFCGCFSGVAGCSGTAVCVVKGSRSRCKEKRFRVPDYENRTCSPCCSRCQMDFWGCFSGVAGCSGTAVCVVKGSWTRFARPVPQPESRRIDLPEQVKSLLIMRTALAVRVAAAAKWISGAAPLGLQAVPERWSVWSRAAGADAKRNGFVCPIMRSALAASVATVAKWISGGCSSGGAGVPERQFVSSRAAGTGAKRNGFVCPIMKTALAASVAAAAKWISGAASLGVQAVPERQFV